MSSLRKAKRALLRAKRHGLNIPETGEWRYERPYAMFKADLATKLGYGSSKTLFANHIHPNKKLMKLLFRTGYKIRAKFLTQKQVDLISHTVGRPIISEIDEGEDLE